MIKNYFTVALRHISRGRLFSTINIFGLSIGLACAMAIVLFIRDDLSFDRFHADVDRIYRVGTEVQNPDGSVVAQLGGSSLPVGPLAKEKVVGVGAFTRMQQAYHAIKNGDEVTSQQVLEVDPNFFSLFSFRLREGNPAKALAEPRNVVIDLSTATRLFGKEQALGKSISFVVNNEVVDYVVSGVAENCPSNSTIRYKVLMPLPTPQLGNEEWLSGNSYTFFKLDKTADPRIVESNLQKEVDEASKDAVAQIRAMGYQERFVLKLQPMTEIHLSTTFSTEGGAAQRPGGVTLGRTLSIITFFIVLIACINFVNLTLSRSATRAKEIGIRKLIGGQRRDLVLQFLGETFLSGMLAFGFAIVLMIFIQPFLNDLTGKNLSMFYLFDAGNIALFVGLFVAISLCAGLYPALVLSSWRPLSILYNRFKLSGRGYLQKTLVIMQFGFATVIIAGTLVVYQQYQFMLSKGRNINITDVMAVMKQRMTQQEAGSFRNELLKQPDVLSVGMDAGWASDARVGVDSVIHFDMDIVDPGFIPVLGIELIAGRNFSTEIPSDVANAIIVNETFAKKAGWTNPIGKEVLLFPFADERRVVVGVIKDYFNRSVADEIQPQALIPASHDHANYSMALVKIKPGTEQTSIANMAKVFRKIFPIVPFEYRFLEDDNAARYASEMQLRKMTLFAAIVTIIISCTGLFGLSIATSERRYREISIRKILGATEEIIVTLLFRSLLGPVFIGVIIALPVAWHFVNEWLAKYPYRIDARWIVFGGTLLVVAALAVITIVYHAIRTSRLNVADAMKNE